MICRRLPALLLTVISATTSFVAGTEPTRAGLPAQTELTASVSGKVLRVKTDRPEYSDTRIYEYEGYWSTTTDRERIVVVHVPKGDIERAASANAICRPTRVPGEYRSASVIPSSIECRAGSLTRIEIDGNSGADVICVVDPTYVDVRTPLVIRGLGEADSLTGGAADDELAGGEDNDILRGRGGADSVFGYEPVERDSGAQIISDHDLLFGEAGADLLWGGPRDDLLVGGAGADIICGSDPETAFPFSCQNRNGRDLGHNIIHANESLDRDLNTGIRFDPPLANETDRIDCGGSATNSIRYNTGLDTVLRCPSPTSEADPPQYPNPYARIPSIRSRTCPRAN